jgi:hypothetical protein
MLHDEEMYPEPFKFSPDRFLSKDGEKPAVLDPANVAFGYGRRSVALPFFFFWLLLCVANIPP